MAGADAVKQTLWLTRIPSQRTRSPVLRRPEPIFAAANPGQHDRRKHIDLHAYSVLEKVWGENVTFEYIPTDDNHADVLTKALNDHIITLFPTPQSPIILWHQTANHCLMEPMGAI